LKRFERRSTTPLAITASTFLHPRHLRQHGDGLRRQGSAICRFLQMCGHYLVQSVACTPASGGEKVEIQVGLARERFFTPRLRAKGLEELNVLLLNKCIVTKMGVDQASARSWRHLAVLRCSEDADIWCPRRSRVGFSSAPMAAERACEEMVRVDVLFSDGSASRKLSYLG